MTTASDDYTRKDELWLTIKAEFPERIRFLGLPLLDAVAQHPDRITYDAATGVIRIKEPINGLRS